jgi:hypothetical protein
MRCENKEIPMERQIYVDEGEIGAAELIPPQAHSSGGSWPAVLKIYLKGGGMIEIKQHEKVFQELCDIIWPKE